MPYLTFIQNILGRILWVESVTFCSAPLYHATSTVWRAGYSLLTISRPIVRFEMPGMLRLGEQDGFRLHGYEQPRLVRIMR